jgi:hypothetical protein
VTNKYNLVTKKGGQAQKLPQEKDAGTVDAVRLDRVKWRRWTYFEKGESFHEKTRKKSGGPVVCLSAGGGACPGRWAPSVGKGCGPASGRHLPGGGKTV